MKSEELIKSATAEKEVPVNSAAPENDDKKVQIIKAELTITVTPDPEEEEAELRKASINTLWFLVMFISIVLIIVGGNARIDWLFKASSIGFCISVSALCYRFWTGDLYIDWDRSTKKK